jgi:hypothetical protein
MAIVAMLVLLFTAGAGGALLADVIRSDRTAGPAPAPKPGKSDPFAPPSLVRARAEQVPWGRALLEFTHPAMAVVGVGMWVGFTLIHQKVLGAVAVAVLAITALIGVTWFTISRRGGQSVSRRTLATHATGAILAIALAILATAHP